MARCYWIPPRWYRPSIVRWSSGSRNNSRSLASATFRHCSRRIRSTRATAIALTWVHTAAKARLVPWNNYSWSNLFDITGCMGVSGGRHSNHADLHNQSERGIEARAHTDIPVNVSIFHSAAQAFGINVHCAVSMVLAPLASSFHHHRQTSVSYCIISHIIHTPQAHAHDHSLYTRPQTQVMFSGLSYTFYPCKY